MGQRSETLKPSRVVAFCKISIKGNNPVGLQTMFSNLKCMYAQKDFPHYSLDCK